MQIGPYHVIQELGRGGMAQVLLAHRVWEDGQRRSCVLKLPRLSVVTDPGILRQFLEESRLAILLRHNNIVSVFDVGVHEGMRRAGGVGWVGRGNAAPRAFQGGRDPGPRQRLYPPA